MGVEARLRAFLRGVLSATWIAVASLALAVAGDILARTAPRPAALLVIMAPIGSLVGVIVCRHRVQGKGVFGGVLSMGICVYAGLVALLLVPCLILIP